MSTSPASELAILLQRVRACTLCRDVIPEPRPVLRASAEARVLIIGQAPGIRVHATGIPWNDASGRRLREWMDVDEALFYDDRHIAIVPMGFCYPGKGRSGDLPPRPECASTWHDAIVRLLPEVQCTLLIGQYAQSYYLPGSYTRLTDRVQDWRRHAPATYVLPHPSPRNQLWLRKNPWFEADVVPHMQQNLKTILAPALDHEHGHA